MSVDYIISKPDNSKKYLVRSCWLSILLLLLCLNFSDAAVTVTAPANGTCLDVVPGNYITLDDIVISETNKDDLPVQSSTTIILTAPSGFQFNPGVGTVTGATPLVSGNISSIAMTVTASTITVTITVIDITKWDIITIIGIQVKPVAFNVSGNILRLSGASGGTAIITGDAPGAGVSHGYLSAEMGQYFYTIASGNWSNPSIWSGGMVPSCADTVVLYHNVTSDLNVITGVLIVESTGTLTSDQAVTVNTAFIIYGNGTYIHNNNDDATLTIFKGTESFSTTSTIEIKQWYNTSVAFPSAVSGNFGNITFNQGAAWGQQGLFAPSRLKGTLKVSSGTITMDQGTGMTTSLVLSDVVINNTGALYIATGSPRNLNLTTGNYTDTSTSATKSSMLFNCQGNLTWTVNGNVYISHSWSGYQHTGNNPGYTTISVNGDFTIAGGTFDINLAVKASLDFTVTGNTTITGNPTSVRFIDRNTGDLNFTTTNFYIEGGNANQLMGGSFPTGNQTVNVINNMELTGASTDLLFYNYNNSFAFVDVTIGSDLIVTDGSLRGAITRGDFNLSVGRNFIVAGSTASFTGQLFGLNTASTTIDVTGYFEASDSRIIISQGRGDISVNVVENIELNNPVFYGIFNTSAVNNGPASLTCNNLNFNGGVFSFFYAYSTSGTLIDVNILTDINIEFISGSNRFSFVSLGGSSAAVLDMDVGYNITIGGNFPGSYFLSSASSGIETVDIGGIVTVNAGDVFFVGNESTLANSHNIATNIGGDLVVNGGNVRLSTGTGLATVNISGGVYLTGGTLSLKYATGISVMNISGVYDQAGGQFNIHSGTSTINEACIVNVYGNFRQANGTFNFDNAGGSTLAEHSLYIYGASYIVSGTGIIKHANNYTSNYKFGKIYFARAGTTSYYRNSGNHQIQHVRQTVNAGTTLDASASNFRMQITSVASSLPADNLALVINGTLDIGSTSIEARQYTNYYAFMTVNSGARFRTSNINGFYTGLSGTAGALHGYISGLNRTDYYLDANSTVEVYGTTISQVTGIPNGIATTSNHMYGILEVNFTGTAGFAWVYPETNDEVHIRTSLILSNGEFNLDSDHSTASGGRAINIENGAAITWTNGFIRSETEDGSGLVRWNITANGSYVIPFGYDVSTFIPFTYQQTSGTSNIISLGTYRSLPDNTPYPPTVTHVRNNAGIDNSASTVDRFWYISVPGTATSSLTFVAAGVEASGILDPRAQLWEPVSQGWFPPSGVQSNPTAISVIAGGITEFNNWWTLSANNSPLPVQLINFDVKKAGENVKLYWTTVSEINNHYFSVERSSNGTDFETIGQVMGAGNSNALINYDFTDTDPLKGINYYRLRQTDFDGTQTYTETKSVTFNLSSSFSVYPNPVSTGSSINITAPEPGEYYLQAFDNTGRLIHSGLIEIDENLVFNSGKINFYPRKGIYLFRLAGPDGEYSFRLLVK